MSDELPNFELAIEQLKKAVKFSDVKNQKHLDFSLVGALERRDYELAMMAVNKSILKGELTHTELLVKLGL